MFLIEDVITGLIDVRPRFCSNGTVAFPSSHDALFCKRGAASRDDRAVVLAMAVVEVKEQPIPCFLELMGHRRVGKHGGVAALPSLDVEDRQPGFLLGIEPARCDQPKLPGLSGFPLFTAYIQEFFDRRDISSVFVFRAGAAYAISDPGSENVVCTMSVFCHGEGRQPIS